MSTVKIFVGTMRPPYKAHHGPSNLLCPCGQILTAMGQDFHHWQDGHFDTPVYADVDPVEVAAKRKELE